MCEIEVGGYIATKQKNGTFIYKSKNEGPITLKPKASYKDKPQYPVIDSLEKKVKADGKKMIFDSGIQIIKQLDSFL